MFIYISDRQMLTIKFGLIFLVVFQSDQTVGSCTNATDNLTLNNVEKHRNIYLINSPQCGVSTLSYMSKIVGLGGNKTGVFEFPWMALIAYNNSNTIEFKCGGSIINKRYILTAAHCITSLPKPLILKGVRIGEHDLSTEEDCEGDPESGANKICAPRYVDLEIEKTLYHPNFMVPKLQNDVGLIRVSQDIDFSRENIRPICLPVNQQLSPDSRNLIITGWGETETAASSNYLVKVILRLVTNDYCKEVYKNIAPIGFKQICAGGMNRRDSCIGDSGGPLQSPAIINDTVRFIQQGIVSFGLKTCGVEGYPGVYTKVICYLDWILDNVAD